MLLRAARQNRDTWAMPAVQGIIKTHFIFWQQYVSTPEGQTFVNFYRVASKPVVMILDAETKTKLKEWVGFIEPDLLVDNVTAFVGTYLQSRVLQPARQPGSGAASRHLSDVDVSHAR